MSARAVAASLLVVAGAAAPPAHADDDRLAGASIIYARGDALYKSDARGKDEVLLAKLPSAEPVRALRTDARAAVLLVDVGGAWSWMKLDGTQSTLAPLPCADGPAQLAVDGRCVLCRSAANPDASIIHNLASARATTIPVPPPSSRLVAEYPHRRLVWADTNGVWSAPPGAPQRKTKVAPEPPLRGFLPSPDGKRAVGVYTDVIHDGRKSTKPADVLMGFALDGQGARRKSIRDSVPLEWSHDGKWVLVQDGSKACIVSATGGQYKCWRGYTAVSIAPDGAYALLLGTRDNDEPSKDGKKSKGKKDKKAKKAKRRDAEPADEPQGEPEQRAGGEDEPLDDVPVPPPGGPVALYRGKLEGAYTERPSLLVRDVAGAAVWVPAK